MNNLDPKSQYLAKCVSMLMRKGVSTSNIKSTVSDISDNLDEIHQEEPFTSIKNIRSRFGEENLVLENYSYTHRFPWRWIVNTISLGLIILFPIIIFAIQYSYGYYEVTKYQISYSRSISRIINNQLILYVLAFTYYFTQIIRYAQSQDEVNSLFPNFRFINKYRKFLLSIPLIAYIIILSNSIASSFNYLVILFQTNPLNITLALIRVVIILTGIIWILVRFDKLSNNFHTIFTLVIFSVVLPSLALIDDALYFGFDLSQFTYTLSYVIYGTYQEMPILTPIVNIIRYTTLMILANIANIIILTLIIIHYKTKQTKPKIVLICSINYFVYVLVGSTIDSNSIFLTSSGFDIFKIISTIIALVLLLIYYIFALNEINLVQLVKGKQKFYSIKFNQLGKKKLKFEMKNLKNGKVVLSILFVILILFMPLTQVNQDVWVIFGSPGGSINGRTEYTFDNPGHYNIIISYHKDNFFSYYLNSSTYEKIHNLDISEHSSGKMKGTEISFDLKSQITMYFYIQYNMTVFSQLEVLLEYSPFGSVFGNVNTWLVISLILISVPLTFKEE